MQTAEQSCPMFAKLVEAELNLLSTNKETVGRNATTMVTLLPPLHNCMLERGQLLSPPPPPLPVSLVSNSNSNSDSVFLLFLLISRVLCLLKSETRYIS
jgi:hypothetical protein